MSRDIYKMLIYHHHLFIHEMKFIQNQWMCQNDCGVDSLVTDRTVKVATPTYSSYSKSDLLVLWWNIILCFFKTDTDAFTESENTTKKQIVQLMAVIKSNYTLFFLTCTFFLAHANRMFPSVNSNFQNGLKT